MNGGQGPFTFVEAPQGHFYADPFIVEQGERTFLFLEDYHYLLRSASLVCLELSHSGEVLERRTIVDTPYHISYPQVFCWEGTYYMIPETASANRVELYRAVEFPWEWKLERILLTGMKLTDPTHAVINGKHWIFSGVSSSGLSGHYDELHLFYAPTLYDRFRSHAGNPVKTDVATSRPGGAIIVDGNRVIRPAQDCSRWYGCGLNFMCIEELNEAYYSERRVSRVPDGWIPGNHLGTHTFNTSKHFQVIDVCSYGLELSATVGRARSLLRKTKFQSNPTEPPEEANESEFVQSDTVSIPR